MGGRGSSSGKASNASTPAGALNAAIASMPDLPALQGSQKQVDWANNIRSNAFEDLNQVARSTMVAGKSLSTNETFYNDLTPERQATLDSVRDIRSSLQRVIGAETSASTIIDNRDYMQSGAKSAVRQLAAVRQRGANVTNDQIDQLVRMSFVPSTIRRKR